MATKIQEGIEKAKQELVLEKEKKEQEEVSHTHLNFHVFQCLYCGYSSSLWGYMYVLVFGSLSLGVLYFALFVPLVIIAELLAIYSSRGVSAQLVVPYIPYSRRRTIIQPCFRFCAISLSAFISYCWCMCYMYW